MCTNKCRKKPNACPGLSRKPWPQTNLSVQEMTTNRYSLLTRNCLPACSKPSKPNNAYIHLRWRRAYVDAQRNSAFGKAWWRFLPPLLTPISSTQLCIFKFRGVSNACLEKQIPNLALVSEPGKFGLAYPYFTIRHPALVAPVEGQSLANYQSPFLCFF